jgi:hypothetical protein
MRLKHLFSAAAVAVAVVGLAGQAEAAAIISVTPTPVIVEVGDTFSIDVMIDADDPVGGFDLDLTFDSAILTPMSLSIVEAKDNQFGSPFFLLTFVAPDLYTASIVGDPIGANLLTNPFQAVRATFQAAALGVSAISLPFVNLSDELGADLLDQQVSGGLVCVVADKTAFDPADCALPVPEPGLMALLATGLATAAVRRRRAS